MKASRSHDEATVYLLQQDPGLAEAYLHAALEEINQPGGEVAFLAVLRQVALARGGIAQVAAMTGMKREAVSRALSPRGNPTLKTLAAICGALGVTLDARVAQA